MPRLSITTRDGVTRDVEAAIGDSVLRAIQNAGIDEIYALCGGCCACATCHVHFDQDVAAALPTLSVDEDDLLDSFASRTAGSRLSCQVRVSEGMDGARIVVAAEL